jgi:lipopolysaccharide biosynthesis protein
VAPSARIIGALRNTRQIISVWPEGEIHLGPKIVLFMHFDAHGAVRPQLLEYMRDLKENGRTIVFVSNAGKLQMAATRALQEICDVVILRQNIGYDFGAWRDAIDFLGLPRVETEEVIVANDSVFGPLLPLGDTLRRLNYNKADIWGLTEKLAGTLPSPVVFPGVWTHRLAVRGIQEFLANGQARAAEILCRASL